MVKYILTSLRFESIIALTLKCHNSKKNTEMSYIEKHIRSGTTYLSFVKKHSFMGKGLVIKEHIGKAVSTISAEKYLLNNISKVTDLEFAFRAEQLKPYISRISYDLELPLRVEKKSLLINNLLEARKLAELIRYDFIKEFAFNSNNIEGSRIPREKVAEIIETGNTKYNNLNEVKEVENTIKAMDYIYSGFKFNLASIKRLYYILTKELKMENNSLYPRGFKAISNIVGNSPTTPPEHVEQELKSLVSWYKNGKNRIHPLLLAFDFHKNYEFIHPFLDGNGRTGRLIMNKIFIQGGYFPVIVFAQNKRSYFNTLAKARTGQSKKYYQFMLTQMDKSYDLILKQIQSY